MKKIGLLLIVLSIAGVSSAEEADSMSPEEIAAMEKRIETIADPAARLFFEANIYRAKGELEEALRKLARLTTHYPHQKDWITRSELLSAKLYFDLGMTNAADVTARQVELIYEGTEAAETARLFREKIKQAKEQSEVSE
jgi:hypothetical protein